MKKKLLLSVLSVLALTACVGSETSQSLTSSSDASSNLISDVSSSVSSSDTSSTGTNSSQSSTTLDDQGTMSFEDVLNLLEKPIVNEALYASSAHIVDKTYSGNLVTTSTEEHKTYSDYSSYDDGKVERVDNSKQPATTTTDTYKRRKMKVEEKYQNGDRVDTYKMYENVLDFENNSIPGYAYEDSASKLYVFDTQEEAEASQLPEQYYVLDTGYKIETSPKASYKTQLFIRTIQSDTHFKQTNTSSMKYQKKDNKYEFTLDVEYSYDGDWGGDGEQNDTITDTINLKFTLNNDLTKMESVEYSFLSNDVLTEEDSYLTGYSWEASNIKYETRTAVPSDIMSTTDYFLETVSDVQIVSRNNGEHPVEADKVTSDAGYLFGDAKTYTPSKVLNLRLSNVSSSNEQAVKLESDGFFKVVGKGKTTLTFSYYKKGEDGIYKYTTIDKEVTVLAPNPTSVSFYPSDLTNIEGDTLLVGTEYKIRTYVLPTEANQAITATSSDDTKLEVIVGDDYALTLKPKAVGDVTVTITSVADESITTSRTFHVMSNEVDLATFITENTFTYIYKNFSTPVYTLTLSFETNGKGKVYEEKIDTPSQNYTENFEYTIEGNKITFSNWDGKVLSLYEYEEATITDNGNKITCECGELGGYASHIYNVVPKE